MTKNALNETLRGLFCPGNLYPLARAFYFFLFLVITVAQTYCSLLMEEQLNNKDTQPKYIET